MSQSLILYYYQKGWGKQLFHILKKRNFCLKLVWCFQTSKYMVKPNKQVQHQKLAHKIRRVKATA